MKYFVFFAIILIACTAQSETDKRKVDKSELPSPPPPTPVIEWIDSSAASMNLLELSHKERSFKSDSVLAFDYEGYNDNRGFAPLNEKGLWISTIKKVKKLSKEQEQFAQSILGSPATYEHTSFSSCYEPRLGLVFYWEGKVIAQSAICLACSRLESSALLGNDTHYTEINDEALIKLTELCEELKFSNCN